MSTLEPCRSRTCQPFPVDNVFSNPPFSCGGLVAPMSPATSTAGPCRELARGVGRLKAAAVSLLLRRPLNFVFHLPMGCPDLKRSGSAPACARPIPRRRVACYRNSAASENACGLKRTPAFSQRPEPLLINCTRIYFSPFFCWRKPHITLFDPLRRCRPQRVDSFAST